MSNGLPTFAGRYSTTLRKFTTHEREADLIQAYALGRKAIAGGYGVLDMARVHQASLEKLLRPARQPVDHGKALCTAETFFLDSLSPFEATHRGFRETNQKLQQAVATLERRNQELGIMNRRLKAEARDRQKSQRALRKSAVFYRALFRQARAMEENLRHLSNQIVHVQEEERRRISRELHDETGQALTAISVTLASLGRNGAKNGDVHRVREAQRLLENTMESLHDFALELRPASLDELGLLPALRTYLKNFAKRTGLEVNFLGHPSVEKLNSNQKTALFRIAQESLTNVAKHACARSVTIQLYTKGRSVLLVVADDGKSFTPRKDATTRPTQRLGLLGMEERARLLGGKFRIQPQPGEGTTVSVILPIKPKQISSLSQNAADRRDDAINKNKSAGAVSGRI